MAILFGETTVKKFELLKEGAEVILFGKIINNDCLVEDIVDVTTKGIIRKATNKNRGVVMLGGLILITGIVIGKMAYKKLIVKKEIAN